MLAQTPVPIKFVKMSYRRNLGGIEVSCDLISQLNQWRRMRKVESIFEKKSNCFLRSLSLLFMSIHEETIEIILIMIRQVP